VELFQNSSTGLRVINVYSNAPLVRLGAAGPVQPISPYGYATFKAVPYAPAPATLTATALAADGATALASHTVAAWGQPVALRLTVDAPSAATGTGSAVYLDGGDVALLRATVVDAAGNVCSSAAVDLTFAVTAGPGLVWGSGSGNPSDHGHPNSPNRTTYHGLARAVVRAALVGAGSDQQRALLAEVNVEAGAQGAASILAQGGVAPTVMTVTVTAPGLQSASLDIPLSVDPKDSVLSVAAASVGAADVGE
jgi:hypothetical protein